MKQSLQIRMGQQLTMTPQLQQAIKLLQLASVELQQEIQQILASNPMLEIEEESAEEENLENPFEAESAEFEIDAQTITDTTLIDTGITDWEKNWENSYSSTPSNKSTQDYDGIEREIYERQDFSNTSLQDHLAWQLHMTSMSAADRQIATVIIDAINDDGYLTEDLSTIQTMLQTELTVEPDEIAAVLHRVQHFDPIGIGARDLAECLCLQLQTYPPDTPGYQLAKKIIQQHLHLLATHDYARLKRITNADEKSLRDAELLIQSLNPKPGAAISSIRTEYVVPDVFVVKKNGLWELELNPDLAPKLRINTAYANLIQQTDKGEQSSYLRNNLQEARWFLKSLQGRNETIMKVADAIVRRQQAFLEQGAEAMEPMVLRDVAEELAMHESTISRVTNQKYLHTPKGIFEFKYFFSSHVGGSDGSQHSATAIRAMIKRLVASENPKKPLSDNKIARLLSESGIHVARRTIAKYRESIAIAPSNERKILC